MKGKLKKAIVVLLSLAMVLTSGTISAFAGTSEPEVNEVERKYKIVTFGDSMSNGYHTDTYWGQPDNDFGLNGAFASAGRYCYPSQIAAYAYSVLNKKIEKENAALMAEAKEKQSNTVTQYKLKMQPTQRYNFEGMRANELHSLLSETTEYYEYFSPMDAHLRSHIDGWQRRNFDNVFNDDGTLKTIGDDELQVKDGYNWTSFKDMRVSAQADVKTADLIVVDVTNALFGTYLTSRLEGILGAQGVKYEDFSATIDDLDMSPKVKSMVKVFRKLLDDNYGLTEKLSVALGEDKTNKLMDTLLYCFADAAVTGSKTLEDIYRLNPDAKVIFVGPNNCFEGISVALDTENAQGLGLKDIPIGDLCASAYEMLGDYFKYADENAPITYYVDTLNFETKSGKTHIDSYIEGWAKVDADNLKNEEYYRIAQSEEFIPNNSAYYVYGKTVGDLINIALSSMNPVPEDIQNMISAVPDWFKAISLVDLFGWSKSYKYIEVANDLFTFNTLSNEELIGLLMYTLDETGMTEYVGGISPSTGAVSGTFAVVFAERVKQKMDENETLTEQTAAEAVIQALMGSVDIQNEMQNKAMVLAAIKRFQEKFGEIRANGVVTTVDTKVVQKYAVGTRTLDSAVVGMYKSMKSKTITISALMNIGVAASNPKLMMEYMYNYDNCTATEKSTLKCYSTFFFETGVGVHPDQNGCNTKTELIEQYVDKVFANDYTDYDYLSEKFIMAAAGLGYAYLNGDLDKYQEQLELMIKAREKMAENGITLDGLTEEEIDEMIATYKDLAPYVGILKENKDGLKEKMSPEELQQLMTMLQQSDLDLLKLTETMLKIKNAMGEEDVNVDEALEQYSKARKTIAVINGLIPDKLKDRMADLYEQLSEIDPESPEYAALAKNIADQLDTLEATIEFFEAAYKNYEEYKDDIELAKAIYNQAYELLDRTVGPIVRDLKAKFDELMAQMVEMGSEQVQKQIEEVIAQIGDLLGVTGRVDELEESTADLQKQFDELLEKSKADQERIDSLEAAIAKIYLKDYAKTAKISGTYTVGSEDVTATIKWSVANSEDITGFVLRFNDEEDTIDVTSKNGQYIDKFAEIGINCVYTVTPYVKLEGSKTKVYGTPLVVAVKPVLKKVTNFNVKKGTNSFKLTWKKNTKANGYVVYYGTVKNTSKMNAITVKGQKKVSATIAKTKLKKGKTYYVAVRAYKDVNGIRYLGSRTAYKAIKR